MEDDDRELVRRLFVEAAAHLEEAHEAAMAGQRPTLSDEDRAVAADTLLRAASAAALLADAAALIGRRGASNPPDRTIGRL